jgi:hypothetical protein
VSIHGFAEISTAEPETAKKRDFSVQSKQAGLKMARFFDSRVIFSKNREKRKIYLLR